MEGIAFSLAIKFAVHELGVYGESIDWAKVKSDFDLKVSAIFPKFWSRQLQRLADGVIDAVAAAMKDSAGVAKVLDAVAAKDLPGAERALLELVGALPGGVLMLQAIGAAA